MDQAANCANAGAAGKSERLRIRRIRFDPILEGSLARWSRSTGPIDWSDRLVPIDRDRDRGRS